MMKTYVLAVLAASSALVDAADSEQKSCTAHDCGHRYDLNPLTASEDYVFTSHSGRNFSINVCRSVVTDLWNPRVDRPQDVGGFTRGDHGDISIGEANSTLHVRNGNPVLYLTDGSNCPKAEGMKISTAIRFICDTSVDEGIPQLVAQLPPDDEDACAFFIDWRTKFACPVPDRYAYWKTAVMVIVIFLALILTVLALLALHKLIKRRRSAELYDVPPLSHVGASRSWPSALAERARDVKRLLTGQDPWGHPNGSATMAADSATGIGGRRFGDTAGGGGRNWRPSFSWAKRGKRSNFSRLPRSAEEEAMMGHDGGPFSVDDDDDDDDDQHTRGVNGGDPGAFAEESAAWGAARPRGIDGSGVIRL